MSSILLLLFADTALLSSTVSVPVVVTLANLLTIGATWLVIDRLRSFTLAGETS